MSSSPITSDYTTGRSFTNAMKGTFSIVMTAPDGKSVYKFGDRGFIDGGLLWMALCIIDGHKYDWMPNVESLEVNTETGTFMAKVERYDQYDGPLVADDDHVDGLCHRMCEVVSDTFEAFCAPSEHKDIILECIKYLKKRAEEDFDNDLFFDIHKNYMQDADGAIKITDPITFMCWHAYERRDQLDAYQTMIIDFLYDNRHPAIKLI